MSYDLRSAVGWITGIAVIISVGSYILALPIGILVIITGQDLGPSLASLTGNLVIEAFLIAVRTPILINALVLVITCIAIYVICFVKAATSNGGFPAGVRLLLSGARPNTLPNWLAVLPLAGSSLFLIVILLTLVQGSAGVSTGNLGCPPGTPNCWCLHRQFGLPTGNA